MQSACLLYHCRCKFVIKDTRLRWHDRRNGSWCEVVQLLQHLFSILRLPKTHTFVTTMYKIFFTLVTLVITVQQISALQISCDDYEIQFVESSRCLINEYAVFINNAWLACIIGDDSFLDSTSLVITTMCNNNTAQFLSSYPNQIITCNNHNIKFIPDSACLANEFNVIVDNVSFICVPDDDTYSSSVMFVVRAFCGFGSKGISVTN